MSSSAAPYVGVATPQANPTVEVELRTLLDTRATPLATRLVSRSAQPAERLVDYLEQIDAAVESFDTLQLAAFGFACTGSSYLVGIERELTLTESAQRRFGFPIVTATQAIGEELHLRGARRIALLAPYPENLLDASIRYWGDLSFDVVAHSRIDVGADTRAIYALDEATVGAAIERFDTGDADVLLLSGTGMPTLEALRRASEPTLSSNLCLAGAMLRRADRWRADQPVDARVLLGQGKKP